MSTPLTFRLLHKSRIPLSRRLLTYRFASTTSPSSLAGNPKLRPPKWHPLRKEIEDESPPASSEPVYSVDPAERKRLSENIRIARSMSNKLVFPKGAFRYQDFLQAKDLFDSLVNIKSVESSADTVNLAFDLWRRIIEEINYQKQRSNLLQLIGMDSVRKLLKNWGVIAREKPEDVPSPQELAVKLLRIARSGFQFSDGVPGILMDVLADQNFNNKRTAPFLAESLMKIFRENALPDQTTGLEPNVFVYSRLIKIWAESGRPEVLKKIDKIFKNMGEDNVPPNVICYTIFIKISAQKASVSRIDRLLESMKNQRVELDGLCINEAIYGYVRGKKFDKAIELFDKLLKEQRDSEEYAHYVFRGAQRILESYNRRIEKDKEIEDAEQSALAAEAENVFAKADKTGILSKEDLEKLSCIMMGIYTRAHEHEKAEALFKRVEFTFENCEMMIRTLAAIDPERATKFLKEKMILNRKDLDVDIAYFNIVLSSWANSGRIDSIDQVLEILRIIKVLDVEPDLTTFKWLLRTIGNSKKIGAWKKAQSEVERLESHFFELAKKQDEEKPEDSLYGNLIKVWGDSQLPQANQYMERLMIHWREYTGVVGI